MTDDSHSWTIRHDRAGAADDLSTSHEIMSRAYVSIVIEAVIQMTKPTKRDRDISKTQRGMFRGSHAVEHSRRPTRTRQQFDETVRTKIQGVGFILSAQF